MGACGSEARRRGRREVRATALDDDPDIAGATDGAGLVERDPYPLETKLLQQQQRQAVRKRLDQLELGGLDIRQHPLGDSLVVHRVGDVVRDSRTAAVDGQLEVDHDGLLDAPFPLDEADDALGRQAAQEYPVGGWGWSRHACRDCPVAVWCWKGTAVSVSSGHWARAWIASPSRSPALSRASPATAI